jgi:hypothetical protein
MVWKHPMKFRLVDDPSIQFFKEISILGMFSQIRGPWAADSGARLPGDI